MYRKGVSALIINNHNQFLLVNLESFEEKYFAIPGGGIESKESLEDAVYREIKEELNIEKKSLLLIGKSDLPIMVKFKTIKFNGDGKEFDGMERYFFGFKFIGNKNQIKVRKDEIRAYEWVSFDQLKNYLLFDNQLQETTEKIAEIFTNLATGR
ncbi:MAG: NUDIX hydrolase [Candidatus Vogelbacteria bacterium]|nr:NUDIX hydrolase [Candidatus Vogelbacteria bacterium]